MTTPARIALIAACDRAGVIGVDNRLPWYLPEDLQYFKRITLGKPIIMGRKTFESIGRPLPGRCNLVVTANPHFKAEGVKVASSPQEALRMAQHIAHIDGTEEIMVIGGAQIYAQTLAAAQRLYLTQVEVEVTGGDAYFPQFDSQQWQMISEIKRPPQDPLPGYRFCVLEAVTQASE
ncbi:dihydrofolate reductase [Allopseudospirillum japonicum]|uniref:Dihydrofolate reductase n=1 Tax=Allopseudospirillum japonicum TaxID=64971 RepID=A0A1H6SRC6_9GAMM|nr:dihydrofolate reductase [Allopseudospirillum japonicum]SEI70413.1 dihydrofolate reductase [Allopseudospirillum japonicum]